MAYYHGIKTSEKASSIATPAKAAVGITFAVGTAPVYMGEGGVNTPVLARSYAEAVEKLGYSDDWGSFTLCEVMKTHFALYGVSPVVFVNVLDPATHKSAVTSEEYTLVDGRAELPDTAIKSSLEVKATSSGNTLTEGTDYTAFYDGGKLIVEKLSGGAITGSTVYIGYDKADISKVNSDDVIGGIDVSTGAKKGLELVNSVFSNYGIVPELIIAPGFSDDSAVAAVMQAKANSICGLFKGKAIIDADCKTVKKYSDVIDWKSDKNISGENQILCWPMVSLGGVKYHLSSHIAALMAQVDSENGGIPSESPSNKAVQADSTVLADGTEVIMELSDANVLNSKGIVTAMNFNGRFALWGNETACFPASTDVKDYFIPVNRMFGYVAQSLILTFWSRLDSKMSRRLIDSVVDTVNIWLNGLKTAEHLLGGRIEFISDENPTTDLMAGKLKFHLYITPPSPAKEMEFTLEYDADYVSAALGG
ncbi:MAG: phage tail sheath subtilisin-like domain-containing protein [Oscillospiraceae bacterium]|nr:phage tail sheath subtilisin-like domain-containing protein [Oscillospiraceae bacterium]